MDPNTLSIIGLISFIVGVIALIVSLIQSFQSNKQTKRLQEHSSALGLIADSLTTRYIGPFPQYLPSVINLLETAVTEIKIVKGNPTPAYFTDPLLWINYSQSIERKTHSGVAVSIICMGENQRKIRLAQQFPTTTEKWNEWIKKNDSKVEHFLKFGFPNINIQELNYSKFLDLLLTIQSKMLLDSFKLKGVEVTEIDQLVPVQVWISDKKQAVFSIQTLPTNAASHGFITSDPRIVSALYEMTELFSSQKLNTMDIQSRIDTIIVTEDLEKSISLYRDLIGLQMRLLSNPVAIFKYDYASLYVYQDSFFKDQFGIKQNVTNGMISIEISSRENFKALKLKLTSAPTNYQIILQSENKLAIHDFNNLIIEFWVKS
jgi:hypothetical protein